MTVWFTENSTFPMVTGVILVIILLGLAFTAREKIMLYLAVIVGLLTAGTVICERMIITDQEEVMQCVYELADAVQANDKAAVVSFVSKNRDDTIARVNAEMPRYDFDSCRIVGKNYYTADVTGPDSAEICFIVSVKVRIGGQTDTLWGQRKITLNFQREGDGNWRIIDYSHEDPRGSLTL